MRLLPIGVAGALVALSLAALPADAQTVRVKVVSACGAETYPTNVPNVLEIDTTGKLCVAATVSATASIAAFAPVGTNNAISVTSTTARTALTGAAANSTTLVENSGTTDVFVAFGDNTVTVTAANGTRVPAGWAIAFNIGTATNIAYITASSTSTISATTGTGLPALGAAGSGGGGGGAITAAASSYAVGAFQVGTGADGWDATQGAKADAAASTDTGTFSFISLFKRLLQGITTIAANTSAAIPTGGNVIGFVSNDPCSQATKLGAPINLTASGQVITGTSAKKTYICAIDLMVTTAGSAALVEGTGTVCATNIFGLAGGTTAGTGWPIPATGGLTKGAGSGTVISPSADANGAAANVCLLLSGTGQTSGHISYVQQ